MEGQGITDPCVRPVDSMDAAADAAISRLLRSINGTVNTMYSLPKKGVKNVVGTSPNGIGLLGKDERRSVVRGRGSKGREQTRESTQAAARRANPQFPGSINHQIKQCHECKRRPIDRTNANMRLDFFFREEIGILLRKNDARTSGTWFVAMGAMEGARERERLRAR